MNIPTFLSAMHITLAILSCATAANELESRRSLLVFLGLMSFAVANAYLAIKNIKKIKNE